MQRTHKFNMLSLLFLLFTFSFYNCNAATIDSTVKKIKIPEDTIVKLVNIKGKEVFIKELDERIEKAKTFILDHKNDIESNYTQIHLNLLSRHYNLGIDTLILLDTLPYYYYYSLHNLYFRDVKENLLLDTLQQFDFNVDSIFFQNIYKRSSRFDFTAFCQYFQYSDTTLQTLYIISEQNIQKKLEIYGLVSETIRKGCSDKSKYLPILKSKLKTDIFKILDKKVPQEFMDKNSIMNPIKAIGYSLYAGDITVKKNGKYILYLINNQEEDGGWHKELGVNEENSVLSTIFGLWALCEVREQCKAL